MAETATPSRPAAEAAPADTAEAPRPDAGRPPTLAAAVAPLLVDTDAAAAACGVSPASWYRLKAAAKTPAPVRLGGKVLYRVEDLQLWVSWGCPARHEFEARKAAQRDGRPR